MGLRKGDLVELHIEKMAHGGQGVARLDGFVLFVRGGVPGDRIRARVVRKKKDYAEANILEIIESSPDRITAPCPYSGFCGGCQWQHVRYEQQLQYKKGIIEESLQRIGGLPGVPVHDVLPSDRPFGYRNKMEFSFSDRRWLLPEEMERGDAGEDFALGLHVPGAFSKVLDIEACLLQHEQGNRILQEVKAYAKFSGVPVYGLKSHEGFWRFLTLRTALHGNEWMVNIVTSEEGRDLLEPLAETLCRRFDNISTVVNNINRRRAGIALGESEVLLRGGGTLRDGIGPFMFQISANSFFQTNTLGAERLYNKVIEYAGLKGTEKILDLYSGTGTIPIFLSRHAGEVIGMEIVEEAVRDAEKNCEANGINNCRFVIGDIRDSLAGLDLKPDVLIVDPPRAGMHKDVLARVMEIAAEKVVYVSCNPATLARDLGIMSESYEVAEIQPVDMFPQTYHVEAVARLLRR
ncbi:MAG: 23S rRNA (uracil(1939)-C(5))-methyltransferase RlmD [Pseudomonadota bacterium]